MPNLFNSDLDRPSLLRRVGNLSQVAGIREYTYNSGRAAGVKAVEVSTGPLRYEVLPDRCLDIANLYYKGVPAGYVSKSGIRHPSYYGETNPTGFHEMFLAGALTTCGLNNTGPATQNGPMHGNISNMPAEKIGVEERWDGDDCEFVVRGVVHHSVFYHGDMILRRTITSRLGGSHFRIEDEVENLDFAPAPCLLLYHCQFGWPFLDESTRLLTSPGRQTEARKGVPEDAVKDCAVFGPPVDGQAEQCFYHTFTPDAEGFAAACLFNPELGLGAYVRYKTDTLPLMVEWKMLRSREYVCGLEPATAKLDDRTPEEMSANTLAPLEKRRFVVELGVVESENAFAERCRFD